MSTFCLQPSEIKYSQDSIANCFSKNRNSYGKCYIGETLDDLLLGQCTVDDIPTIRVLEKDGEYFTLDNRRLWVFRKLEKLGSCDYIEVREVSYVSDVDLSKFTTSNDGEKTFVRGGAGGTYWRQVQAAKRKERKQRKWEQEQLELARKLNCSTAENSPPKQRMYAAMIGQPSMNQMTSSGSIYQHRPRNPSTTTSQSLTATSIRRDSEPDYVTNSKLYSMSQSSQPYRTQRADRVTFDNATRDNGVQSSRDNGVCSLIINTFKRWLNL